ncbi:hypothetical protein CKAH01_10706 [Colletotrichum kahawae]|uniref:Uncharacterized protein n=1 Tax=Colletotrichum kahawae TaxID=34407 RepID=A0AAD9XYH4_COLKA|nr:hypothetical protein CKAH01_10706 [Colletotrichum kahawae]
MYEAAVVVNSVSEEMNQTFRESVGSETIRLGASHAFRMDTCIDNYSTYRTVDPPKDASQLPAPLQKRLSTQDERCCLAICLAVNYPYNGLTDDMCLRRLLQGKDFVVKVAALLACLKVLEAPDQPDDYPADNRTSLLFEFNRTLDFNFSNIPVIIRVLDDDEMGLTGYSTCDMDEDESDDEDDGSFLAESDFIAGLDLLNEELSDNDYHETPNMDSEFREDLELSEESSGSDVDEGEDDVY